MTAYDILGIVGLGAALYGLARSLRRMGHDTRVLGPCDGPPPDLVLNASVTPRQLIPDTAVFLLRELGLDRIPGFTVHATCLSFLVALHVGASLIHAGAHKRVLIASAEIASVGRDFSQPESAALFGDGAGAAVLEPTPEGEASELLAYAMITRPAGAEFTQLRGGGVHYHPNREGARPEDNYFDMDGPSVYRLGRPLVGELLDQLYARAGLAGPEDIDLIVPHQASGLAIASLRRYGFAQERVVNVLAEYGNCIAASLPMALAVADREGRLQRGQTVLLVGTGAGLSAAALLLRW